MSCLRPVWMLLGLAAFAALFRYSEGASAFPPEVKTYTEKEAKKFLKNLNLEWAKKTNAYYLAKWDYESNITAYNLARKQKVASEVAKFQKQQRKEAVRYPKEKFQDHDIKRQLEMYSKLGIPGLPDDKYVKNLLAALSFSPRCHKVECEHKDGLGPEEEIKQRLDCWLQRRYGFNTTQTWNELAQLAQEAADMDNYTEYHMYMMRNYEDESHPSQLRKTVADIHPLYRELMAFCRARLRQRYGGAVAPNGGMIPEHLIDDPICQTDPIPRKPLDFPGALRAKAFTVRRLFGLPDEFFRSLNMSGLPDSVWEKSILEARPNITMSCVPVSQDFLDNKDYRMRTCSKVTEETLFVASKLVTEVMYRMEMRLQPSVYRQTMSDALIEGVGGMVALSLVSPNFLRYQGLLAGDDSNEMDVNLLYMIARHTLMPAVRAFAVDEWRAKSMMKMASLQNYNCLWWGSRQDLEGVEPPFNRSSRDFDPGSDPRVLRDPFSTPFKTTTGTIIAFAMHKALCQAAGLFDPEDLFRLPLHRCNLLGQPLVSKLLSTMMKAGASRPWRAVIEEAIGRPELNPEPLIQYFQPLEKFLNDWSLRTGEVTTWNASHHKTCMHARWHLQKQDSAGAAAGYYSCPTEAPEPKDAPILPEVTLHSNPSLVDSSTTAAATSASTSGLSTSPSPKPLEEVDVGTDTLGQPGAAG